MENTSEADIGDVYLKILQDARSPNIVSWGPADFARALQWTSTVVRPAPGDVDVVTDAEDIQGPRKRLKFSKESSHPKSPQTRLLRKVIRGLTVHNNCSTDDGCTEEPSTTTSSTIAVRRKRPSCRSLCGLAKRAFLHELLRNPFLYEHPQIEPILRFILHQLADADTEGGQDDSMTTTEVTPIHPTTFEVLRKRVTLANIPVYSGCDPPSRDSGLRNRPPAAAEQAAAALLLNKALFSALAQATENRMATTSTAVKALVERERCFVVHQPAALDIVVIQILQPWNAMSTPNQTSSAQLWTKVFSASSSSTPSPNNATLEKLKNEALLPVILDSSEESFLAIHPHFLGCLCRDHFSAAKHYINLLLRSFPKGSAKQKQRLRQRLQHLSTYSTTLHSVCSELIAQHLP